VLEKDAEDQLGRSYEKLRNATRFKEECTNLQIIKIRKAIWIGHILGRSCLLKHVIEGKKGGRLEVTRRQWERRRNLLYDV
jgi:hypothetical protein